MLAGFETVDGRIEVMGLMACAGSAQPVNMFQNYALFPHMALPTISHTGCGARMAEPETERGVRNFCVLSG